MPGNDEGWDDTVGQLEQRLIAQIQGGGLDAEPVSPASVPALPAVGSTLAGHWRVTAELGRGAFGAVFEVQHAEVAQLRRAVKFLLPEHAQDPEIRLRFREEAVVMATVKGPHLVDVTDYGEHQGAPFLMMERLEGEPLQAMMSRTGVFSLPLFREFAGPLLDALGELHGHQIVHRDLKPANVFVTTDASRLKVLDYGLAKTAQTITRSGGLTGTPLYMAPEQFSGEGDERSDLYSASVVLYQMLAGALPIVPEGNIFELARRVLTEAPIPLRRVRGDVPPAVAAAIEQGLAKDAAQRPPTAQALRASLFGETAVSPVSVPAEPPAEQAPQLVSVRLLLGRPRRSTSLLSRAFRPKVKLEPSHRFRIDSPIAGTLSSTVPIHVVVVHVCSVTRECVRVYPSDDDRQGAGPAAIPTISAGQARMVIEGYATEPAGAKEFRAYWSREPELLAPLLSLPDDDPVPLRDAAPILSHVEERIGTAGGSVVEHYEVVP